MKASEYQGLWWLPATPQNRCYGVLRCNEDGELRLDLLGSLVEPHFTWKIDDPAIIHGEIADSGKAPKVTLKACFVTKTSHSWGDTVRARQEFFSHRAYFGEHLTEEEDFKFQWGGMRFSGLEAWAHNLSGFKREPSDPFAFSYKLPQPISGEFSLGSFVIGLSSSASAAQGERRFTESADFNLSLREGVPESILQNIVYWLQNFFTLATDHPNVLTKLEVSREKCESERITVIGPGIFTDESIAENLKPWEMLFTLPDIAGSVEVAVGKWFEFSKRFPEVISVYFSSLYNPPGYVDVRFQLIVQALSLYHSRRIQQNDSNSASDELLRNVRATISQEQSKAIGQIFNSHPLVMAERAIENLTQEHHDQFAPLMEGKDSAGRKHFLNVVLKTLECILVRPAENTWTTRSADLYWLTERVAFLLKICMLSELGFKSDKLQSLLGKNQRFGHIRDLVTAQSASSHAQC